jgi:thiamine-phosphate diphosphorylase
LATSTAGARSELFRLLAISRIADGDGAAAGGAGGGGLAALAAGAAGGGLATLAAGAAGGWLAALGAAGVDGVMLREKRLADRALFDLAAAARQILPPPTCLLVNGRADVALGSGADGVHLPADGVPAGAVRARFGRRLLIGVSTHAVAEVERARDAGADYVVFGPVYATPGKTAAEPPGVAGLARAVRTGIPVYALGGVTLERFAEVAATGAAGVAAIRLFQAVAGIDQVVRAAHDHFP